MVLKNRCYFKRLSGDYMYDLLCEFESLIVLKTIMDSVDMNFIGIGDLEEIDGYAKELDIDTKYVDLESMYNFEIDSILDVYNEWYENVNDKYLEVKNGLLNLI